MQKKPIHIQKLPVRQNFPMLDAPFIVDWEITSKCTYNCFFCQAGLSAGKTSTECNYLDKVKILKKLGRAKVYSIFISGGDPLLSKDLFKIYELAVKLGIKPMMSTNGIEANLNVIKSLRSVGLKTIQISLQGTEEVHDAIVRYRGAYRKVIKNIQLMLDKGLEVKVAIVGLKENYDNIPFFIDEMSKIGVEIIRVLRFIPCYDVSLLNHIPLPSQIKTSMRSALEVASKKGISLLMSACPGYEGLTNSTLTFVHPSAHFCPAGKTRFSIASDGTVFPCVILKDHNMAMGNLLYNDVGEIWQHSIMNIFRNITPADYTGKCQICQKKWLCYSCRGIAWTYSNNIRGDDISCYELAKV